MERGDCIFITEITKGNKPYFFAKAFIIRAENHAYWISDMVSMWEGNEVITTGSRRIRMSDVEDPSNYNYATTFGGAVTNLGILMLSTRKKAQSALEAQLLGIRITDESMPAAKDIDITDLIYGPEFNKEGKRLRRGNIFSEDDDDA